MTVEIKDYEEYPLTPLLRESASDESGNITTTFEETRLYPEARGPLALALAKSSNGGY
jgi:hypothetical protein